MHFLNGAVSLPFFRHVRRGETTKKGCVIRSIFQVPTTHVSVVLTKENEKGIGDLKTCQMIWAWEKGHQDARGAFS